MLYLSLFLSAVLLVIAIGAVWCSRKPVWAVAAWCAGLAIVPWFGCLMLPALMWHSISLIAAVSLWRGLRWNKPAFVPLAIAATLVSYGWFTWSKYQEIARWQQQHPRESLEARLPTPKPVSRSDVLAAPTQQKLEALEVWLEREAPYELHYYRHRADHLKALHENAVDVFVNSPGFGVSRMPSLGERTLSRGLRNDPPILNPGDPPKILSPGEWDQNIAAPEKESLGSMHETSLRDFIHPAGFGFVKDRSYVLGFQSHRFSKVPAVENWKVHTVELIGLLLHEQPVTYVSAHLPRMDELRKAPTRKLDDFESIGLAELRKGEDLFVAGNHQEMRMLGAVRSVEQCVKCHGSERGDLLGVFSYTLRR